ncbi:MurR/RpiR family transcriptional regulator [Aquabacterium sp.]|uniref:MurR/RpiR family transcriptional regulator n=1 Tax=Aquabacterium sp. TaxID=1872578 RepID=UPI0037845EAB
MLNRTQTLLDALSPAERRVGAWLLAHPQAALAQDTRTLAAQIGVSQPTLVRFARSLGCAGFDDFRLQWARESGAAPGPAPVTLATLATSPSLDALCRGVFDFSLQALAQVRDRIDRRALAQAVQRLDEARRIVLHGQGNAAPVAAEAQRRLQRVPLPALACAEAEALAAMAQALSREDLLVLVSHAGRAPGRRRPCWPSPPAARRWRPRPRWRCVPTCPTAATR